MIQMNDKNIVIIGLDHGYGNIKTAGTVTPTGITAYESEPVFSGNILKYDGRYFRIGEGHKEFISDKSADEDFYLFTLMAIAKELRTQQLQTASVYLAVGLPLTWVRMQRDSFKEYLLRKEEVSYQWNGRQYDIRIVGCSVYPQGFPALMKYAENMKGVNVLCDIGNGTMNILYLNGKTPIESKCWTEKFGVNQCMIAAKNAVLNDLGVQIDESIIEQVLRTGTADIGEKYLNCIIAAARKDTAEIFSTLRKYEYNPDLMRLTIVGGGGCLVRNFGTYEAGRVKIIDDVCAAAKGFEALAASAIKRKDRK